MSCCARRKLPLKHICALLRLHYPLHPSCGGTALIYGRYYPPHRLSRSNQLIYNSSSSFFFFFFCFLVLRPFFDLFCLSPCPDVFTISVFHLPLVSWFLSSQSVLSLQYVCICPFCKTCPFITPFLTSLCQQRANSQLPLVHLSLRRSRFFRPPSMKSFRRTMRPLSLPYWTNLIPRFISSDPRSEISSIGTKSSTALMAC